VDAARRMAGVVEVAVAARPGDVLGHIVDWSGLERVGYVVATGKVASEAAARAKAARDCCRLVTETIDGVSGA
jgi:hypothetical protein